MNDNSMTVNGGSFVGSAVGAGTNIQAGTTTVSEVRTGQLNDLRSALTGAREQILAAATTSDGRTVLRYELQQIEEALAAPEPAGPVVRSRWEQVRKAIGPLAVTANIAQITALIITLFGRG